MTAGAIRVRTAVIFTCGALAAAVLIAFVVSLLLRKGEVAQLLDILAGPDAPDAAWAFEELKEVGDEELTDLLEFIEDDRVTPLHSLHWESLGAIGGTSFRSDAFRVRQVALFVLAFRIGMLGGTRDWELDQNPRSRSEWALDVEELQSTHLSHNGEYIPPHPEKHSFLAERNVRPPSRVKPGASLAARDPVTVIDMLRTGGKAEAAWALEYLRGLPDDGLDRIVSLAGCVDRTRVTHLERQGSGWGSEGIEVGRVVQFVLNERMGRTGSENSSMALDPEHVRRVEAAWIEFRSREP